MTGFRVWVWERTCSNGWPPSQYKTVDLNPILALPAGQGCLAVDARIRVAGL